MTVYTRRDHPDLPECVEAPEGYTVVHVPAGPAELIPRDDLLGYMGPFAQFLDTMGEIDRPDVAHAHFWMSGIATQLATRHLNFLRYRRFVRSGWSSAATREHRKRAGRTGCGWLGVADRMRLFGSVAREYMPAILRSADAVACTRSTA